MSPAITPAQSAEEIHALSEAIDEAARRQDWPAVAEACRAALDHPCAQHAFYTADLWTGLAEAHAVQERYEDAIDALQHAVALGHRAWPHPETDIARLHLLAGNRADADALFEKVRAKTPDDIWLYRTAADGYAQAGDEETAERWLSDGIETGIRTGDPEGMVGQFNDARSATRRRHGKDPDDLTARAATFVRSWDRPAPGTIPPPPWPEDDPEPPAKEACDHCGWAPVTIDPAQAAGRANRPMAIAFFVADEWPRAVATWPYLLNDMPADHYAYVRELESRIQQISEATGARLTMVPMSVGGLLAFCEGRPTLNAGSGEARAEYAGLLVGEGHGRPWPPGRNEPCWCGSRRKYKQCCGSVGTLSAVE